MCSEHVLIVWWQVPTGIDLVINPVKSGVHLILALISAKVRLQGKHFVAGE